MPVPIAELFVTVGADVSSAVNSLNTLPAALRKTGANMTSAGRELSTAITAPIVGGAVAVTKFGADFEHAFTRVRKTVDLQGDELEAFRKGLLDLSTTEAGGGKSAEDLAAIAAVAGQLGIEGGANLLKFTQLAAGLSVATGIAADQVGEDLTRIAILTGTPSDAWENMASAIVGLGNEMAGSEAEIITMSERLSGALHTVGVSAPDILGIASAMSALGINAEEGGTAVSKFFLNMVDATSGVGQMSEEAATKIQGLEDRITDLGSSLAAATQKQQQFGRNTPASVIQANQAAIEKYRREIDQARANITKLQATAGGGDIEAFAKVAGVTADEFRSLVRTDPSGAFTAIVEGLNRIGEAGGPEAVVTTLHDLGIEESRMTSVLLRLTTGHDQLTKGLRVANEEWERNQALNEEVTKAMQDTENQFNLLLSQLKRQAIDGWEVLKPVVANFIAFVRSDVLPHIQELLNAFKALTPEQQKNVGIWLGIAAAIGPLLLVFGGLLTLLGALTAPLTALVLGVAFLAGAWVTNMGDIQGKTATVVGFVSDLFNRFVTDVVPAIAPALTKAFEVFSAVRTTVGALLSFMGQLVLAMVTVWELALRRIGAFFETYLLPPIQAIGTWILDHILAPLAEFIRAIDKALAGTGINAAIGGFDVAGALRAAEAAVAGVSAGAAAGGPGAANSVVVNINNPAVLDETVGERFARQVQEAVMNALIDAEAQSLPPPIPMLPGVPF